MADSAANTLAAAVLLLAASTAGRERCDCDRESAARDRSCAGVEHSTNGKQHVNYDIISNVFNIANCSLRWNTGQWVPQQEHKSTADVLHNSFYDVHTHSSLIQPRCTPS